MLNKKSIIDCSKKLKKIIGPIVLNRKYVATWFVLCSILSLALVFSSTCVCYAVSINGQEIGSVSSRSEIKQAVESAEQQASEILGTEYAVEDSVSISANIGLSNNNADDITEKILETVDGIEKLYAITVNGEPIGISSDEKQLWNILTAIMDKYVTADTTNVSFLEDVSVSYMFVNDGLETDSEKISQMLSPENNNSPYSLTVVTTDIVESYEEVPYSTEYIYDDEAWEDESIVLTDGENGISSVYTRIVYLNGIKTAYSILDTAVIENPVTQVISVGTKKGSRTDSTGTYILPADGVFTSYFGYRSVGIGSSNHKGVDIAGSYQSTIYASDGGTVIFAGWMSGYGNLIQLQHDNGDVTYYGHLSDFLVEEGDKVAQGNPIALMGSTGVSSGVHVHFEIRPNGEEPVDPMDYLEE